MSEPTPEELLEEVSTDYQSLLTSAGIDFKKAKAAMRAHAAGSTKDASNISSSVEEAQKKAEKELVNFAAINNLISKRNTLNIEQRKPRKSAYRHAQNPLRVIDHLGDRISDLEFNMYDANPDPDSLKAYVTEVHDMKGTDIENHIMNLNIREMISTATKTSVSGVSLVMVRARCPHNHFWFDPKEPTTSPMSSERDRHRAKCQPSFYGMVSDKSKPTVGDIVNVEFPDKTDLSCGILTGVHLTLPAAKNTLSGKESFNGTGSTTVGD